MTDSRRAFTIIADDYGLGDRHNRVILRLLECGLLDGVSVMVSDDLRNEDVSRLLEIAERRPIQIGLHLNLTEPMPGLSCVMPLGQLLRRSLAGGIDRKAVSRTLRVQFDLFQSSIGRSPDFIDGHQHCHCIPVVAAAVIDAVRGRMDSIPCWIRSPCPRTFRGVIQALRMGGPKAVVIMALGYVQRRRLKRASIATNADFAGIMRLDTAVSTKGNLLRILSRAGPGCVVMTHPGDGADARQLAGHAPAARDAEAEALEAFAANP
ncbi:MAG: ChbG/HpnK family deacetylase [Rhodobiaceae bacterium]|nr:ChbG/HpnK family deacetylase [Rhodobiaceae bacterium]MCC0018149.1 ChbG/HpnK family deacetylase [Rhodobiaceae bacterium]MCC0051285.1 ChbG/HpnK family deacetylase [Rhodobiaceae bacterium]